MLKRGGREDTGNSSMHQKEIGQETKKTGEEAASVRTGKIRYRLFTPRHFIPLR